MGASEESYLEYMGGKKKTQRTQGYVGSQVKRSLGCLSSSHLSVFLCLFVVVVFQCLLVLGGRTWRKGEGNSIPLSWPRPEVWTMNCNLTSHFRMYQETSVKVAQSCPALCDPMDYTVHGIIQAKILAWVAFPLSRVSSQPRDQT